VKTYLHKLRLSENRVPSKILGSERNEVAGDWRRLYNEELHDLYSSSNIIRLIKSRRMWWQRHVARIGNKRGAYRGSGGET